MEDITGFWPVVDKREHSYPKAYYVDFLLPSREELISISNGRFTIEPTDAADWNIVAYIVACDFYDMITPYALYLLNTYDVSRFVEAEWFERRVLMYYQVYAQHRADLKPLRVSIYHFGYTSEYGPAHHDLYPALQYLFLTPDVSDFESVLGNERDASGSEAAMRLQLVRHCVVSLVWDFFGENRTDHDFLFVNVDKYYDLPREVHVRHKLAVSKRVTWDAELPRVSLDEHFDNPWLRMHMKDDTAITASFLAEMPGLVEYAWGYAYTHSLPRTAELCAAYASRRPDYNRVYEFCDPAFYEKVFGNLDGARYYANRVILLLRIRNGTLTREVLHALYPTLPYIYRLTVAREVREARFDMALYPILFPYVFQWLKPEDELDDNRRYKGGSSFLNICDRVREGPACLVYVDPPWVTLETPHKRLLDYFIFRDSSAA